MKTKLPFRSGSNKSTFGFGHAHKAKAWLFVFFVQCTPRFFVIIPFFPLVSCLLLDFIYKVNVSQKTLQKVKFFTKKWQVVGRSDFPSNLPVKSNRFLACKSCPIHGSFLIWAHFFIVERDDVTNGRRTVVPSRAVSGGSSVNGLKELKASGIGLYLEIKHCERILGKLCLFRLNISITSEK